MLTKIRKSFLSCIAVAALGASAIQIAIANPANYVVGGVPIDIAQVPGTVALLNRTRAEQDGNLALSQFCGGTLIAPRWIVTAAHCVVNNGNAVSPNTILALMGTTDLSQPSTQAVDVIQVVVHEEYVPGQTWQRDVALLRLNADASITPVALDGRTQTFNDQVFVAGWGAIVEGLNGLPNQVPTQIHGAALRLVPGYECGTVFPDLAGAVDGTHVCAAVNNELRGSCFGDSGGPLYRITSDNRVGALVGIVSGGKQCGATGIYSNAFSYKDWIESTTGPVLVDMDEVPGPNSSGDDDDEDTTLAIVGGAALAGLAAGAFAGSGSWLIPVMAGLWLLRRRQTDRKTTHKYRTHKYRK